MMLFLLMMKKKKQWKFFESENRETVGLKLPLKLSNQDGDEDTYFHFIHPKELNI